MFAEMPPHNAALPALVTPAASAEARVVRLAAAAILRELKGDVQIAIEKRVSLCRDGMAAAEAELREARTEAGRLTIFEIYSSVGQALRRQIEIDEGRLRFFATEHQRARESLEQLAKAQQTIESGRFEEAIPLLKAIREESRQRFPSKALITVIQRMAASQEP